MIALISDGEIDKDDNDKYSVRFGYWPELVNSCRAAVKEAADQYYLGRKTNGDLMATAMVKLKDETRQLAPQFWYPVIKKLREGGPSVLQPQEIQEAEIPLTQSRPAYRHNAFEDDGLTKTAQGNGFDLSFPDAPMLHGTAIAGSTLLRCPDLRRSKINSATGCLNMTKCRTSLQRRLGESAAP